MKQRDPLNYIADLVYGSTKHPCGWLKPKVVKGNFPDSQIGELQRTFFEELLKNDFKRTYWQIVFPGQIAGIVKKASKEPDGTNEYHTRFYEDGTIDCEKEVDRFHSNHWVGPRKNGIDFLNETLNQMTDIPPEIRISIQKLFGEKQYSHECTRGNIQSVN